MAAYYNEFDPHAAAWLRELIKAGRIADGDVDERSIIEVTADDIRGYTQQHFFAGIGGWSFAARLAGWPDSRPLFTGSPPCQPFSTAGKQLGTADERHLAPHFLALVKALRPPVIAGEQVAAAVKKDNWLDDLLDALEAEDYETAFTVVPASAVGAPHIRQRIFFIAQRAVVSHNMRITQPQEAIHETMQSLQNREIIRPVPAKWPHNGRWAEDNLQGVRPPENAKVESRKSRGAEQKSAVTEKTEPRARADIRTQPSKEAPCKTPYCSSRPESEEQRSAIRPRQASIFDQGEDCFDAMRINGSEAIAADRNWTETLELDKRGQSRAEQGVRLQQHTDSVLGDERGDGGMGSGEDKKINVNGRGLIDELAGQTKRTDDSGDGFKLANLQDEVGSENNAQGKKVQSSSFVGAPHIRQRIFFVGRLGDSKHTRLEGQCRHGDNSDESGRLDTQPSGSVAPTSSVGGMDDPESQRPGLHNATDQRPADAQGDLPANTSHSDTDGSPRQRITSDGTSPPAPGWDNPDWLLCRDGKWRPVEPGTFPLVAGLPRGVVYSGDPRDKEYASKTAEARVMRLKGYGNAIVPQDAAEVLKELI